MSQRRKTRCEGCIAFFFNRASTATQPAVARSPCVRRRELGSRRVTARKSGTQPASAYDLDTATPAHTRSERKREVSEAVLRSNPSESGVVQTLIDEHSGDNQEHDPRGRTQNLHERVDLVDLGNEFRLVQLHLRLRVIQEQLIVLLHGERTAIDQEDYQNTGENTPHCEHPDQRRHVPPRFRFRADPLVSFRVRSFTAPRIRLRGRALAVDYSPVPTSCMAFSSCPQGCDRSPRRSI